MVAWAGGRVETSGPGPWPTSCVTPEASGWAGQVLASPMVRLSPGLREGAMGPRRGWARTRCVPSTWTRLRLTTCTNTADRSVNRLIR